MDLTCVQGLKYECEGLGSECQWQANCHSAATSSKFVLQCIKDTPMTPFCCAHIRYSLMVRHHLTPQRRLTNALDSQLKKKLVV